MKRWFVSLGTVCMLSGFAPLPRTTAAQGTSRQRLARSEETGKPFAFEVLSIRPHKPGTEWVPAQYLPDGYRSTITAYLAIMIAYIPPSGSLWFSSDIANAPGWVRDELYDIDARVAPEDIVRWQQAKDGPDSSDSELLDSALQVALRERFKLAFHITHVEVPTLNIVVGKHGAKLQETVPGTVKPVKDKTNAAGKGFYIQDNGKRQFVGVSMEELARVMMRLNPEHPTQDRTGLKGQYDFTLPWYDPEQYPSNDIPVALDRMPLNSIGLELVPGTGPGIVINVDHIERPSEN